MPESRPPRPTTPAETDVASVHGPPLSELLKARNTVSIELKTHFELDDARIFDLNGKGITVTVVTEN